MDLDEPPTMLVHVQLPPFEPERLATVVSSGSPLRAQKGLQQERDLVTAMFDMTRQVTDEAALGYARAFYTHMGKQLYELGKVDGAATYYPSQRFLNFWLYFAALATIVFNPQGNVLHVGSDVGTFLNENMLAK
jgi:hypothetical protein